MENTNPEGKSLKELIQEADEKNVKLVLVCDPIIDGHHRARIFMESEHFMVIKTSNLPVADQMEINLSQLAGISEPMVFTAPLRTYEPDTYKIETTLNVLTKPWYYSLPDKKRKKGK